MSRIANLLDRRGWVSVWAVLAVPIVYGASFPMARLAFIGWIGFIPWFVAVRRASMRKALLICGVSTLLGSYACTPWLPRAVANYYQQPLILGLLLFAGVYLVTIGPFVAAFVLGFQRLGRRPSMWLPVLTALLWAGAEAARTRLLVGDPFGVFGYSQVDFTYLTQIADVTGVFGLTVLPMAVNAAFAELWLAYATSPSQEAVRTARPWPRVATVAQAWQGVAVVTAMVLAVGAYGAVRIRSFDRAGSEPSTPIGIVQANLDLGAQWRQEFYGRNLEEYMRLTIDVLHAYKPRVVFWPESSMTFFLENEPTYRAALGYLLSPTQTQLVAGGPRSIGEAPPRYYNAGLLIGPDGSVLAAYDKQRLLPFAEYFPFGGSALLRRKFARVREFTAGGPANVLPTLAGPAGVVICNEVMFGELVAERVRAGARYIVALANDSWLGDRQYAEEAFDMARMRAVEQHQYVVRASTSGPSAIIDPLGRVVTRTDDETRATMGGRIRPVAAQTVYARYGDVFGLCCVLIPLSVLLWDWAAARRSRRYAGRAAYEEAAAARSEWSATDACEARGSGARSKP